MQLGLSREQLQPTAFLPASPEGEKGGKESHCNDSPRGDSRKAENTAAGYSCALKRIDVHSYSGIGIVFSKGMHCSISRARANL